MHADVLGGIFRKRLRLREMGETFRRLRPCYPHRRLYVILDNLHLIHDHLHFLALCRTLRITLVFTPTEASWLNLIVPHFGVLQRATVAGSDDRRTSSGAGGSTATCACVIASSATRVRSVKPIKLEWH